MNTNRTKNWRSFQVKTEALTQALYTKGALASLQELIERFVQMNPDLICGLEISAFTFNRKTRKIVQTSSICRISGEITPVYWFNPKYLEELSAATAEAERRRILAGFWKNPKVPKKVLVSYGSSPARLKKSPNTKSLPKRNRRIH